jgi:hypothetical protein
MMLDKNCGLGIVDGRRELLRTINQQNNAKSIDLIKFFALSRQSLARHFVIRLIHSIHSIQNKC